MKEVTLNGKEQKRLMVLNEVVAGRLTGEEAAELLGLSVRQTRRLLARYRREGAAGLAHGNRGREPANKLDEEVEATIVQLGRERYEDYNDCHFTEELAEWHEIVVSRPTVRREHGLPSPRKRRSARQRQRRPRYRQAGMLLQVDGSKHDWLEGRGPWLTLHAAIDDATNEVPWAVFREEEDATGYALLLHHISQTHGLPLALYADRHTIFQSPREATVAEQLAGVEPRTHLGRLLERLHVELIGARSPQAKGRVERLFGTLQDRLVKELRQAGATNLAEANAVLIAYLPRFNQRFMQEAAEPGRAYQPCLTRAEANERIFFTYTRTVANDHTISLFGQTVALPSLPGGLNLARRRVELRHRMDGQLVVVYQGQSVSLIQPAQPGPPRLETFVPAAQHLLSSRPSQPPQPPASAAPAVPRQRQPPKPAADHPWRRPYDPQLRAKKQQQQQQPKHEKEPG